MGEKPAVNTTETAAPQTEVVTVVDDTETRIASLEAEKAKLIEESANWKLAALKNKNRSQDEEFEDDDDERIARIARKTIADSRLGEIAREQDEIIRKALKENKELKLAQLNKKDPSALLGTHSEGQEVRDTLVTSQQIAAFKARGWDDKKIERYKKNLQRYA